MNMNKKTQIEVHIEQDEWYPVYHAVSYQYAKAKCDEKVKTVIPRRLFRAYQKCLKNFDKLQLSLHHYYQIQEVHKNDLAE